jgi:hypothetical protein
VSESSSNDQQQKKDEREKKHFFGIKNWVINFHWNEMKRNEEFIRK